MYISLIVTDQDGDLGLLESSHHIPFLWLCAYNWSIISSSYSMRVVWLHICVCKPSCDICPWTLLFPSHITSSSLTLPYLWVLPFSSHISMIGSCWSLKVINYLYMLMTPLNLKSPESGFVHGGHNIMGEKTSLIWGAIYNPYFVWLVQHPCA